MPTAIRSVRDRVGPLFEKMANNRLYEEAVRAGHPTLSHFLETEDPSDPEERRAGEDAYRRMLMVADVRTASDRYGTFFAHPLSRFQESEQHRSLFPEYARRLWVGAARPAGTRAAPPIYLSSDFLEGSIQRPYDDDTTLRTIEDIQPAIPLAEIIARRRVNQSSVYRARYLTQPAAADIRMLRVTEGAELPAAKISEGTSMIRLRKFGRKLEASYEALRELPLDDFALHVRLLALQTEVDQVSAAFDVLVNGDGNANTSAESFNLTTVDTGASANAPTFLAWTGFKLKWKNPLRLTHVIAREPEMLKLLMLAAPNANPFVTSPGFPDQLRQSFTPIDTRLGDGVRFGISDDAPAGAWLGFDARLAVEHVVEAGSDIQESAKWITRQVEVLTFSFNENYAVVNPNAAKILHIDA